MGILNPFTLTAVLYVTVGLFFAGLKGLGALDGAPAPLNLNWLRVHVITIGTITQVIFAVLPGYVARKLGTDERPRPAMWLQWALLNVGLLLVIVGVAGVDAWTGSIGATVIFASVWLLFADLLRAYRASGRRWSEGMRFYLTGPLYLLFGIIMAVSLLFNWWAPGGRIGVLEAHVHANVWGFLSLIVAGMLFDLFPALTGGPMARPHWNGRIYYLLNAGAFGLVVGPWLNRHELTVLGLLIYVAGTAVLITNLVLTLRANRSDSPAAMQVVLSYLWMVVPAFFAPFIVLAPGLVPAAAIESAATQGLVNGWVLGMVMGALPRLLRTRAWARDSGPPVAAESDEHDGSWVSVIFLNAGVALIWATVAVAPGSLPAQALMLSGYSLIAIAWVPFLRRSWTYLTA